MKTIRIIVRATDEVVETIDVSNETDTNAARVKAGLVSQMNHEDYRIEVDW